MIPVFKLVNKDDLELMQIQNNVKEVLDAISKATIYDAQNDAKGNFTGNFVRASGGSTFHIADSVLLRGVQFKNPLAPVTVNHGLGRTPSGIFLAMVYTVAQVLGHPDNLDRKKNPDPTRIVILQATASCAADLVIF